MKKTDMEQIRAEEIEFLGEEIEDRFVSPKSNISNYKDIKVNLVYIPNYRDFIESAYVAGITTWNQTGHNFIEKTFGQKEFFVRHILKTRKISAIMEIPVFVFSVENIPRSMTHQIVRHRNMAFSQQSFRVSSCYPDTVRMPNDLPSEILYEYNRIVEDSRELYKKMVENGIPIEQARNIMPMGTTTKIVMTTNMKALKDYIKARTLDIAQGEHTFITEKILKELKEKSPEFYELVINW